MKILYVINSLNTGGAEKLCVDIIKNIKQENEVEVYVLNNVKTNFSRELESMGVIINNSGTNKYRSIKHLIWLIKNRKKYQIIHSHLSYSQYYVAVLRLFSKNIKLITTEHNTYNRRREYKLFKVIEDKLYKCYNKIIVINSDTKDNMISWQPTLLNKICVINNGVNIEKYNNGSKEKIKDEILLDNNIKKVLMVAAFREQKNHDLIIDAFKYLPEEYNLILVGDGELRNNILNRINNNNLKDRVHILGVRSDVENIMKCCDVFVLPSKWEGFGLVSVEAMASGLPVIASNVKGLSQVVGEAGILFDVNNIDDLVKSIIELTKNDDLRNKVINEGLKRCREFDINKTSQLHIDIYDKLIEGEKLYG